MWSVKMALEFFFLFFFEYANIFTFGHNSVKVGNTDYTTKIAFVNITRGLWKPPLYATFYQAFILLILWSNDLSKIGS